MLEIVPPVHRKPTSTWHVSLQPSPPMVLLSSHCSRESHSTFRPSPQTGAHVSRPPFPFPSVRLEVQLKPTSMEQSASQPSPAAVLLSSHTSAVDRMPFPQMCTGGVTAIVSSPMVSFPVCRSSVTEIPPSSSSSSRADSPVVVIVEVVVKPASRRRRRRLAFTPPITIPEAFTSKAGCGPMCGGSPSTKKRTRY